MNKQGKLVGNKVIGGIEWTKTVLPDSRERQGFTWNPIGGCLHGCRWLMPNGTLAICYAEDTAKGVAHAAYPEGFEHHYWHPEKLVEPGRIKVPARIFIDSMADLFGHWVSDEQIEQVIAAIRTAPWHTYQALTKNAPRLLTLKFPACLWVGVSSPPDHMFGHPLNRISQEKMLVRSLEILSEVKRRQPEIVTWMSVEPLSWDVAPIIAQHPGAVQWVVIGAASDGRTYHQPMPAHVQALLTVLDHQAVPVFFKGNLAWKPHRENFPAPTSATLARWQDTFF